MGWALSWSARPTPAGGSLHYGCQKPMETWPTPQSGDVSLEVLPVNISSLEEIHSKAGDISVATEGLKPG